IEIPTVAKMVRRFELDDTLPSVSVVTMHRMLEKFGLKYKKQYRNALLIEATHIIRGLCKYQRQINKLRRQKKTFFTPTRHGSAPVTRWDKCGSTRTSRANEPKRSSLFTGLQNPSAKGGRPIMTHCGNENRFVPGFGEVFCPRKATGEYYEEMNGVHYHEWFTQKIAPLVCHQEV
ncbi:hypothetical protein HPB47_015453, partial [Ixodes persulcatus]